MSQRRPVGELAVSDSWTKAADDPTSVSFGDLTRGLSYIPVPAGT